MANKPFEQTPLARSLIAFAQWRLRHLTRRLEVGDCQTLWGVTYRVTSGQCCSVTPLVPFGWETKILMGNDLVLSGERPSDMRFLFSADGTEPKMASGEYMLGFLDVGYWVEQIFEADAKRHARERGARPIPFVLKSIRGGLGM